MPDLRRARGLALTASAALLLPAAGAGSVHAAEPPPGRGYELVSPLDTNDTDVFNQAQAGFGQAGAVAASEDGDRVVYGAFGGFAGAPSTGITGWASYQANRSETGWATTSLQPPMTWAPVPANGGGDLVDLTPDLSTAVIASNQPLVPGVPDGLLGKNLYLRELDGTFTALTSQPAGSAEAPRFGGISDDGSHVVFASNTQEFGSGLYEWADGVRRLVAPGAELLQPTETRFPRRRLISGDGAKIVFSTPGGGRPELFVRLDGATTQQVSASQRTPAGTWGTRTFHGISRDGGTIWFSSKEPLTDDANTGAANAGNDLYAYDVASGRLTDVSVSAEATRGANVLGVVALADDGATAYFVAQNRVAGQGVDGSRNLFVARDGETRLIGQLAATDNHNWIETGATSRTARTTPDGSHLVFVSRAELTGYDNRHATSNVRQAQVFLFDAEAEPAAALSCISCNPSGRRPVGASTIQGQFAEPGGIPPIGKWPRNVSDDGDRVFFDSADALLPAARNGRRNVYMWEAGELRLLSSGSGMGDAFFGDASRSGDDAFFTTTEQLVPLGLDDKVALWDARVGGGFPVVPTTPECRGDVCQGPPTAPPVNGVPGSFGYVGRGNVEEPAPQRATITVAKVSAAAQRRLARTGRLTLKVTVSAPGRVTVAGTSKLPGARARTKVLGAARTATAAGTLSIPVRLTGAASRALARGRALSVRVEVRHARAAGVRRTTLRLPGARPASKRSVNSSTRNR